MSSQEHEGIGQRLADGIGNLLERDAKPVPAAAEAPTPATKVADDAPVLVGDAASTTGDISKSYVGQIYDNLVKLFGSTSANEVFVMEFPGRVLDPDVYRFPVTSPYSILAKPQIVSEEEFRLTDTLFDVAPKPGDRTIVNGPNDQQLSLDYQALLSNLVPLIGDAEIKYAADKQTVRGWLAETVDTDQVSPTGEVIRMSRMAVYEQKVQAYTAALLTWRQQKEAMYEKALADPDPAAALERYARDIAEESQSQEAAIAGYWDDLVARGYYHEVREALGFLDVATAAELLEQAKASMRQSGVSSLDETQTVYPIQLQPTDWFNALVSDFSPIDLLMDPASIQSSLIAKESELDSLHQQIAAYLGQQTGNPADLQQKVDAAQAALDTASTALTSAYLQNTITAVKMYLASKGQQPGSSEAGTQTPTDLPAKGKDGKGLSDADWQKINQGLAAVGSAQQTLTQASAKLADLLAAKASAEATAAGPTVAMLQSRIDDLNAQIKALNVMLDSAQAQAVLAQTGPPTKDAQGNVTLFDKTKTDYYTSLKSNPTKATGSVAVTAPESTLLPAQINGNWETVVIRSSASDNASMATDHSASSTSSFSVNLFFGSVSGTSSSDDAEHAASQTASTYDISIGMLVTKVTVDRGGWFEPNILTGNPPYASLYSTSPTDGSIGYPTAFIVAKDVSIVMSNTNSSSSDASSVADAAQSTSGGFLCFSVSSSSTSHSDSHQTTAASFDESVVIRIPQPQIIGWFAERMMATPSAPYNGLPAGYPEPPASPKPAIV